MKLKKIMILLCLSLFLNFNIYADTRTVNIDVFLVVDKSLSMEGKIESVNNYINESIIKNITIPGDMVNIIVFYGKTDVLINSTIIDEAYKSSIINKVSNIKANGRFTDIGSALDVLASVIPDYENNGRLKYMLLITDGKQEAPLNSPYYSPDGTFNHKFLEHTRIIKKQGWKIHILGIGKETDAKAIAEELSGSYSEVDTTTRQDISLDTKSSQLQTDKEISEDSNDLESFDEKIASAVPDFLSFLKISTTPVIVYKGFFKKPYLTFETEASNINSAKTVNISSITLTGESLNNITILDIPENLEFSDDGKKTFELPISFPEGFPVGNISGELKFDYGTTEMLTPSVFTVSFTNLSFLQKYFLAIIAASVIFLLIVILIIKSVKSSVASNVAVKNPAAGISKTAKATGAIAVAAGKTVGKAIGDMAFYCYLDGKKLSEIPFILKNSENIYLNISPAGVVNFTKEKLSSAKAKISAKSGELSMDMLDKFILKDYKQHFVNIFENSFNFLKKNGKEFLIDFKRK